MDHKTKTFIIFPFLLIIVFALAADSIPFKRELSEVEKQILKFSPTNLKINERPTEYPDMDLTSLLDFSAADIARESTNEHNSVSNTGDNDMNLSLIIINEDNRMAIIEDTPVKEGDIIADMKIVKIEHNRVLLKNRTEKWIYVD